MDTSKFMELFNSSDESEDDFDEIKKAFQRALDNSDVHFYYDISGDGTAFYRSGARNGIGYASCIVTLREDGLASVRATSLVVPKQNRRSIKKLCGSWNTFFKLKGLKVDEDGRLVFESAPFDPISGRYDADEACSLALSTVHHYASAIIALEAGAEPWDLIDLYEKDDYSIDDDGGDKDGGTSVPSLEEVRDLLQSMQEAPKRQATAR